MKTVYIADDGREFNTKNECVEYEKLKEEERKEQEKYLEEKKRRKAEVDAAYERYCELEDAYADDYYETAELPTLLKFLFGELHE